MATTLGERWRRRRYFRISRRQLVVVVVLFILLYGFSGLLYQELNAPPPVERWPAFYAWNPATGALEQPLGGDQPFQTFVLEGWLDRRVPFVPILGLQYMTFGLIVQVFIPLLTLAVSFKRFVTFVVTIMVADVVGAVSFYLFQTQVPRTDPVGIGFYGWIMNTIWGADQPFNAFPSGHTFGSTIAIIGLLRLRVPFPKTAWFFAVWMALTYPAVLMVGQHYVIDVYTGIAVGIALYWIVMFAVERPMIPRSDLVGLHPRKRASEQQNQ